jgi:DNA-binding PadR family transcriptional regulator
MARRQSGVAWSDPALLILGRLASGPEHGYGIVQDTESTVGIALGLARLTSAADAAG